MPSIPAKPLAATKIPGATAVWRRRLDDTFEFLNDIRKSSTQQEICRYLLRYAERFGATNLLAGPIPPPRALRREQLSHVLLDAWPEQWSERYFSKGYLYRDPTIQLVNRGNMPFLWSEIDKICNVCPFGRRVMEEATEFRLREGLTIPFATIGRPGGGVLRCRRKAGPGSSRPSRLSVRCRLRLRLRDYSRQGKPELKAGPPVSSAKGRSALGVRRPHSGRNRRSPPHQPQYGRYPPTVGARETRRDKHHTRCRGSLPLGFDSLDSRNHVMPPCSSKGHWLTSKLEDNQDASYRYSAECGRISGGAGSGVPSTPQSVCRRKGLDRSAARRRS